MWAKNTIHYMVWETLSFSKYFPLKDHLRCPNTLHNIAGTRLKGYAKQPPTTGVSSMGTTAGFSFFFLRENPEGHFSGWWFQPTHLWKILYSQNGINFPKGRSENKKYLKPPPSFDLNDNVLVLFVCIRKKTHMVVTLELWNSDALDVQPME